MKDGVQSLQVVAKGDGQMRALILDAVTVGDHAVRIALGVARYARGGARAETIFRCLAASFQILGGGNTADTSVDHHTAAAWRRRARGKHKLVTSYRSRAPHQLLLHVVQHQIETMQISAPDQRRNSRAQVAGGGDAGDTGRALQLHVAQLGGHQHGRVHVVDRLDEAIHGRQDRLLRAQQPIESRLRGGATLRPNKFTVQRHESVGTIKINYWQHSRVWACVGYYKANSVLKLVSGWLVL